MATYYRWRQSTILYEDIVTTSGSISSGFSSSAQYYTATSVEINTDTGTFEYSGVQSHTAIEGGTRYPQGTILFGYDTNSTFNLGKKSYYLATTGTVSVFLSSSDGKAKLNINGEAHGLQINPGSLVGYVYSTTASAYPNGGVQGNYYYDQRTTITSPTAPTNLQYPNPITTPTVTVSWDAAVSNVPGVTIAYYGIDVGLNNVPGPLAQLHYQSTGTSYEISLPPTYDGEPVTSAFIGVYAVDTNGKITGGGNGPTVPVYFSPTLTVPSLSMQNQPITVNWTAIDGATSYTLQRKANTDTGWVQVYSGPNLTFTETVGAWTSVQYQVQAVFSSGAGGWATSASIPVVSASALVISGTDEDLGTLTADVPYTVSSDTGNPITLTRTVNGNVVATLTVQSGFAYTIPVMDLPTGSGTIEISASVTATSGPVSATRTWTYTKTAITFPNSASVGQLNQDGTNIFPATLAEAVRVPTHWGGTLDKALELLYDAANSAVISVGTYEGSGTYGVDNPNTLTISPSPQVVTIYGGGQTLVISSTDTSSPAYIDGTTVKWYSTVSAAEQMNTSGVTYSYVAVAKGVTA